MNENRKMRGEVELQLMQLSRESAGTGFEILIARPGFVQPKNAWLRTLLVGVIFKVIQVDHLAAGIIRIASEGGKDLLCENDTLAALGKSK